MSSLTRRKRLTASDRTRSLRLHVQSLEERTVPALSDPFVLPGDTAPVIAAGEQELADVARGANGSLVVWTDSRSVLTPNFSGAGAGPYSGTGLGTMYDILAARLDADGNVVDTTPIVVAQSSFNQVAPRVAWNGQSWLVSWYTEPDQVSGAIHAARIGPDGTRLDATPIVVTTDVAASNGGSPWSVTSDGSNWAITWFDFAGLNATIEGARVSAAGTLLDPVARQLHFSEANMYPTDVDMAFAGDEYLMTWMESGGAIRGQRLTPALNFLGPQITFETEGANAPKVATNGDGFLVTWTGAIEFTQIVAARVSHAGQVLDPGGFAVSGWLSSTFDTSDVGWDGTQWVVTYDFNQDIQAARISPAGVVLDPNGIAVSQGPGDEYQAAVSQVGADGKVQVVWTDPRTGGARGFDIYTAQFRADGTAAPERAASLGAARQSRPDVASNGNGFLAVFQREESGGVRVMAQRLDAAGQPIDAQPITVAPNFENPAVAWNGSVYLVVFESVVSDETYGMRLSANGTPLDAAPFRIMDGQTPDVAVLGDTFLVTNIDVFGVSSPLRRVYTVRVSGEGAVLGTPTLVVNNYSHSPRVEALGDRWLVVYQSRSRHDTSITLANVRGFFVNPDGTTGESLLIGPFATGFEGSGSTNPSLAVSGDTALVVWEQGGTNTGNVLGRRISADGTFLDGENGFVISDAPWAQLSPEATWDGTQFLVTWVDHRADGGYPRHPVGDVFAARVSADGTVLDPNGMVIANSPLAEDTPVVVGANGLAVFAYAGYQQQAPYAAHRITLRTLGEVAPAAPRVAGVAVNAGQANATQRSRVTSITVTFDAAVAFAGPVADAFAVSRIGGGAVGGFTAVANVVGGVTVVTLSGFTGAETEFGSLADGRYQVAVRADQVTAGGRQLDGDGDGTAGGDYTLNGTVANGLYRLFGDADGNGVVNAFDFGQFRPAFGASTGQSAYVEWLDIDGDGLINAFDFGRLRNRFGAGVP